jgi:biotin transport system substrate-specific component
MTALALPARPVLADYVPRTRARDVVLVMSAALFTALLAQLSVAVPGSPVPITGQTLAVVLTGAALGPWRGLAGQVVYVALGALGLPFYADAASGWQVLSGATGGYLVGFLPAAWLVGVAARFGQERRFWRALVLFAAGQAVIFAVGVPWLAVVADLSPARALELGFYPFLLGGVVKAGVASGVLHAAWRRVAPC